MSAVRKCLMKELLEYYMTAADKTCGTIKTFAFLSHPPCYVKSGPGFCSIITDPRNYDALYRGYQLKDFVGDDWKVVWRQVCYFSNLTCQHFYLNQLFKIANNKNILFSLLGRLSSGLMASVCVCLSSAVSLAPIC